MHVQVEKLWKFRLENKGWPLQRTIIYIYIRSSYTHIYIYRQILSKRFWNTSLSSWSFVVTTSPHPSAAQFTQKMKMGAPLHLLFLGLTTSICLEHSLPNEFQWKYVLTKVLPLIFAYIWNVKYMFVNTYCFNMFANLRVMWTYIFQRHTKLFLNQVRI